MELRAIATLQGEPAEEFQRTSVHVTLKVDYLEDQGKTRYDLAVMGDIREPNAPDWKEGETETGPNYHTSGDLGGMLASPERGERLLRSTLEEIRATLTLRLRRIAISESQGKTVLVFRFSMAGSGGGGEILASYGYRPPAGKLNDGFILQIGTELRAFVNGELQAALVSVVGAMANPKDPARGQMSDNEAYKRYLAGVWPDRNVFPAEKCRDQIVRLHQRLKLPVPQV